MAQGAGEPLSYSRTCHGRGQYLPHVTQFWPSGPRAGRAYTPGMGSGGTVFLVTGVHKWKVAETAPQPKETLLPAGGQQVEMALV